MSRILLSFSAILCYLAVACGSSDEPTPTPIVIDSAPDQVVGFGISSDFSNDSTVFVITDPGGIFRSRDAGATLERVNEGLTDGDVKQIAVSPVFSEDRTAFVTTARKGVFRSTDSGDSWTPVNDGIERRSVAGIAISPDFGTDQTCLLYTSPSPRDGLLYRMPSSA